MRKNAHPIVPVYMFHSIADHSDESPYGHLSMPVKTFDMAMAYLRKHRFNAVTLEDLYNYLDTGEEVPPKSIVITFDDGYLDNWVNVFPILKKYELKASIFVVPEFVDPCTVIRPNLSDVWEGRAKSEELSYWGFLSWNEMREMEKSGLVDIQSHSLTHTWYFQDSNIVDFHHPGDKYPWLAWNKYPERKYLWSREKQEEFVGFGAPVYSHGRALAAPRYIQDDSLANALQEYVVKRGRGLFENSAWRDELFSVVSDYIRGNQATARYETQSEYETRVENELGASKDAIERNLCKTVKFLCWPGGAVNHLTQGIAQKVGYLATTKGTSRNTLGADPGRIHRISGSVARTKDWPILDSYANLLLFVSQVEGYRGNPLYSGLVRCSLRAAEASRWLLGGRREGR